eukprot:3027232-Prymnesium_polylepis.1
MAARGSRPQLMRLQDARVRVTPLPSSSRVGATGRRATEQIARVCVVVRRCCRLRKQPPKYGNGTKLAPIWQSSQVPARSA